MGVLTDRCPTCGFDPATVPPADLVVAARSFPRRYRGALVRPGEEDGAEVVVQRPPDGGWSAVEHAAHAADALEAAAAAVRGTGAGWIDPGEPRAASVGAVLERLEAAAGALASAAERHAGQEWQRSVPVGGDGEATVLDVARHGVHLASHHLRAAQQAVDQVRRAR